MARNMRKLPETMNLDDMRSMVIHFPDMLKSFNLSQDLNETCREYYEEGIEGLCYLGMGGSSIVGSYVSEILSQESQVPISIIRDYILPKWVSREWVIVALSYSGNTEETLSSLRQAKERGSKIFTITSGGEMVKAYRDYPQVLVQKGVQPRAAFPLVFSVTLAISESLVGRHTTDLDRISENIAAASKRWGEWIPTPSVVAEKFQNRIPLFIGAQYMSPVAYRAKCQLNENSKTAAFFSEVPEAAHNEIEGFSNSKEGVLIPVFLRSENEDTQIRRKLDVMMDLYHEIDLNPIKLDAAGKSKIENMLSLTHYLDMVSIELADKRGVDAVSVKRIEELKKRIASRS
jgi:glucose/mannose-6-phosphate isomerase